MKYILSILLCLSTIFSYSQEIIDKADNFYNTKDYSSALKIYEELYLKDTNDYYVAGQIGLCYSNFLYEETKAIPYIEKAFESKKLRKNEELVFALATAYMHNHEFDNGMTLFEDYVEMVKNDDQKNLGKLKIQNCTNAKILVNKPLDILFINQGKKINTEESEINPYITKDEKLLIYSSDNNIDYDIYMNIRKKVFNSWSISQEINKDVNTDKNQLISGIDEWGENIYYFENNENIDISNVKFESFIFKSSNKLNENVNTTFCEKGATHIGNDTLVFSSNKEGGFGGYDLYFSIKLPNGSWGLPINLGDKINSAYDENYPSYVSETKTLCFSTNRPQSIGGYDIFLSDWNILDSTWTEPINFGYPLNTTYDENTISYLQLKRYAYVSRYADDSYGKEDIYKAVFKEETPQIMIFKVFIDVYSNETKSVKPINKCNTEIEINITDVETGSIFGTYSIDKNKNFFVVSVPPGIYSLTINGEAYYEFEKTIYVEERYVEETIDDLKVELEQK